jgi:TrmH family RNA methyltransferase
MLTSRQNPLVKQIRKLHQAKERHQENLFLLEGTNLVEIASNVGFPLLSVCVTESWQSKHGKLVENLRQSCQRFELVSDEVMKTIATTVNPDGVLAVASRSNWQKSMPKQLKLGLLLEKIQDPGNLGTIIRTAVATGVEGLWLTEDSVDLDHPKVMRASAGEWFRLNMSVCKSATDLVKAYQQQGVQVIATLPSGKKTYWELDFSRPSLILMGNEGSGLSPQLSSLADQQVKIPLWGGVESLNVAIATSLLLYEYRRQKVENE